MEKLLEYMKTDDFLVVFSITVGVLLLINIILSISTKIKYNRVLKKLGNGNNLDEMLRRYLEDVREIKKDNSEIKAQYMLRRQNQMR